ncbi:MAG TPA: phosphoribosylformylglycinamidine synthase subunit PurL [Gemmatimonadales bacterium]|nr:phosphoribosylformylglycinamidine synthase subunit PurL [Gemmatimonadales bacterium]
MTAQARPGDPQITPELVRQHGLTPDEFSRIRTLLGRDPTWVELGIFSALWSEHCAYKHSRPILKTFPTDGPQVIQGPGENAGVLRLGDGWAVAFKMESHNHPSAVEPYQGAATGVGGILRDIFTMGARPVAVLDSLRFGPLDSDRQRYLMKGVVRGIGDYGNCVGVPTVGGDVAFEPAYEGNPLVNAMAVGLLREEELIRARAAGPGNPIIAVGARTGRDGIHGASFASEELSEQSEARRPQVQVGDPFTEKLLIEASLELIRSGHIVAIQDMGAAGLTSSSAEMAARGGVGVEIDAQLMPTREADMTPYEVLLSESQERMLVVAKQGREREVDAICRTWELTSAVIGRVTDDGMYRVRWGPAVVAEIPGRALVEGAPVYRPEARESPDAAARRGRPVPSPRPDLDLNAALERLLDLPTIASKRWVYEQYDTSVQTNTVMGPGGDAAVLRVRDTSLGLALTSGGSGRFVWLDPYEGGKAVVAEAARNIAVTGARPLGITDCLNFGNPERPEVFYQFREACRGIADACRALGTPVTGGNVSFYNESPTGAVLPSPTIGMVGVLRDIACRVPARFQAAGDAVICFGTTRGALGGSQYLSLETGEVFGAPPPVDLAAERSLVDCLAECAEARLLASAHDVSEGGLAVALVECAALAPETFGCDVDLGGGDGAVTPAAVLFGEDHGRAVVSARRADVEALLARARRHGVPARVVGTVGGPAGAVRIAAGGARVALPSARLRQIYESAIPRRLDGAGGTQLARGG